MNFFVALALMVWAYMTLWFLVSVLKKRNDVADTAWGLGFVLLSWSAFFLSGSSDWRGILVNVLVSVWGLRLAWHIHRRNRGKSEDYRYLAWREEWGKWFYLRSYGQVYILQGIFLFCIALPVLLLHKNFGEPLGYLDVFGLLIWGIGFFFESVGDSQLAKFLKDPNNKGEILQTGLWRYSRHPNYFGEITQWWGIWVLALSVPYGFWGILGPLTITFLIVKISGIPLLEKKMAENPKFIEYKKRTSMLVPFFYTLPKTLLRVIKK